MSLLSLSDDEEYDSPSDRESLLPPSGTTTTTTTTNSGLPKRVKESENGHSASGGGRGLKPGGNGRREYQLINMAGGMVMWGENNLHTLMSSNAH